MVDPRITELEELVTAEGFTLPMLVEKIIRLEKNGFVVDLFTGRIHVPVVGLPTRHAQAVVYLLQDIAF
jgi:hypothetical protein